MIEAKNISMKYGEGENEFFALQDVSVSIEKGTFVSLVGRSGSGKSTFLSILGGLLKPATGSVLIKNENIYEYKDNQLSDYRSQNIGFIFQAFHLENLYTIYQNIEIALMIGKCPAKERKAKIESLLTKVGMKEKQNVCVKNLSGGEKQRVCIARALANDPEIIFADEPCGNLDSYNGNIIMEMLRSLVEEGKTVVLVTHNNEDAKRTDRILEMKDGRLVRDEVVVH